MTTIRGEAGEGKIMQTSAKLFAMIWPTEIGKGVIFPRKLLEPLATLVKRPIGTSVVISSRNGPLKPPSQEKLLTRKRSACGPSPK